MDATANPSGGNPTVAPPPPPPTPSQGFTRGFVGTPAQPSTSQPPPAQHTGPTDPPNYAAQVPVDQWYGTGQPISDQPPEPTPQPAPDPAIDINSQANAYTQEQPTQQYSQYDPYTQQYFPHLNKPIPEELIYDWESMDRPFKKRKKQFFMTAGTIALLISMILFFAGQNMLIAVVIAVLFVSYLLFTIPPHTIRNLITTYGIRNGEMLYFWEELGRFWFEKKYDQELLLIEVARWPNRLTLVISEKDKPDLLEILSEVLLHEKPPLTPVEKAAEWLQEKIPLDLEN